MNKAIITTLLLCTGLFVAGCKEKNYSVEDFKKDGKLLDKWYLKCRSGGPSLQSSQNCKNVLRASRGLD
ncbi:EexN family lipoprotein [Bartonella phoceensis]|uniref:EexN family lipoprotein n=1 Tax=Bartonella phoceensis TaxID=270249 RepID=UPI001ABA3471|nr:EexN family lipoprotein [Bartonella phoceensis]